MEIAYSVALLMWSKHCLLRFLCWRMMTVRACYHRYTATFAISFIFYQSHCTWMPFNKAHHMQECQIHSAISTSSGVVISVSLSPHTFLILIMRSTRTALLFTTWRTVGYTYRERRYRYLSWLAWPLCICTAMARYGYGHLVEECEQVKVTVGCIHYIIWFLSNVTILCMSWLKWQDVDLRERWWEKAVKSALLISVMNCHKKILKTGILPQTLALLWPHPLPQILWSNVITLTHSDQCLATI